MKNLIKILLVSVLFFSCSKEESLCECDKVYYKTEVTVVNNGGVLTTVINKIITGSEKVNCQDEKTVQLSDNTHFEIKCN